MRLSPLLSFTLLRSSLRTMATDIRSPNAKREKVMLKPGFHLVDWMKLTQVSTDMRGTGPLRKISLAELSEHKSQYDCWTAYKGKVYNITQYIAYHPGGVPMLMSGAGRDCTVQFNKFHAWVNAESMLSKCLIGVLMSEEVAIPEGNEEEDEESQVRIPIKAKAQVATIRMSTTVETVSLGGDVIINSSENVPKNIPNKFPVYIPENGPGNIPVSVQRALIGTLMEDDKDENDERKKEQKGEKMKEEAGGRKDMGGKEEMVVDISGEVKVIDVTQALEGLIVEEEKK